MKSTLSVMARLKIIREEADALSALILEALKTGPAPRTAITSAVRSKVSKRVRAWMDRVSSIVRLPIFEGLVCYGPGEGNQATFIRTDQWLPQLHPVPAVDAQKELLRKYLRAYGPATLKDFAHWSGISMLEVRALRPLLDMEIVEYGDMLLLREDAKALQATPSDLTSVHLLPYFDVYLLAHSIKEHFLDARFYKRVFRNQAWISPVVLIDGQIAGVWIYKLSRQEIRIEVELFGRISRTVREQIKSRAQELADLFERPLSLMFKA